MDTKTILLVKFMPHKHTEVTVNVAALMHLHWRIPDSPFTWLKFLHKKKNYPLYPPTL